MVSFSPCASQASKFSDLSGTLSIEILGGGNGMRKTAVRLGLVASLVSLLWLTTGCGGNSGNSGNNNTQPPPSVSISITSPDPLPTTVGSGGTIQFGATVTGSSDISVTWTAAPTAAGTINSNTGLFTAAAMSVDTAVTVVATAAADTSKTATASFKVTAAATITSITPSTYYCDAECMMLQITVKGFGFMLGDWAITNPDANIQLAQFVNSTELLVYLGLDTPHTSDGPYINSDCRTSTSGCSNPATFLDFGNQNNLVVDPVTNSSLFGELFNIDRAAGTVWKFKSDGTPDGYFYPCPFDCSPSPIGGGVDISFDELNKWVWVDMAAWDAASGAFIGSTNDVAFTNTNFIADTAVKNGIVCSPESNMGLLACFVGKNAKTGNATFYRVPAGTEPWSLAMYGDNTKTLIAVIDRATPTLFWFSAVMDQSGTVITLTKLGSVPLPFTPVSELRSGYEGTGTAGGWYVEWLAGGIVAVKAPVLNTATNAVTDEIFFVDTNKSTVSPAVDLPENSFRIAAEPGGNAVDVESAVISPNNPAKVQITISRVTTAGGVSVIYTATIDPSATAAAPTGSPLVGVGFGVSPDGKHLYTCARNQCAALVPQPAAQ